MRRLRRDDVADLVGLPRTKDYTPSGFGIPTWVGNSVRFFSLSTIDRMMCDAVVALGTSLIETPVIRHEGQWTVVADSPEIKGFIDFTLRRFWMRSVRPALTCHRYGFFGGEALYALDEKGLLQFRKLKPLHQLDISSAKDVDTGELGGLIVRQGAGERLELRGSYNGKPAKGLWFYYGDEYNNWYGRSRFEAAFPPWSDKTGTDGTLDIIRMWYYKNAYSGLVVRYPEKNMKIADGRYIPARDMARQIAETLKTGGVAALPSSVDPRTGKEDWSVDQPRFNGNAEGLLEYLNYQNSEILRGMRIPDDVVSGVSGGYAGRKVSEDAFYTMEEDLLHSIVIPLDEQVIRPLIAYNFGPGDKYKIFWAPMQPARQQLDAQRQAGAAAPGNVNPAAGPTPISDTIGAMAQGGAEGAAPPPPMTRLSVVQLSSQPYELQETPSPEGFKVQDRNTGRDVSKAFPTVQEATAHRWKIQAGQEPPVLTGDPSHRYLGTSGAGHLFLHKGTGEVHAYDSKGQRLKTPPAELAKYANPKDPAFKALEKTHVAMAKSRLAGSAGVPGGLAASMPTRGSSRKTPGASPQALPTPKTAAPAAAAAAPMPEPTHEANLQSLRQEAEAAQARDNSETSKEQFLTERSAQVMPKLDKKTQLLVENAQWNMQHDAAELNNTPETQAALRLWVKHMASPSAGTEAAAAQQVPQEALPGAPGVPTSQAAESTSAQGTPVASTTTSESGVTGVPPKAPSPAAPSPARTFRPEAQMTPSQVAPPKASSGAQPAPSRQAAPGLTAQGTPATKTPGRFKVTPTASPALPGVSQTSAPLQAQQAQAERRVEAQLPYTQTSPTMQAPRIGAGSVSEPMAAAGAEAAPPKATTPRAEARAPLPQGPPTAQTTTVGGLPPGTPPPQKPKAEAPPPPPPPPKPEPLKGKAKQERIRELLDSREPMTPMSKTTNDELMKLLGVPEGFTYASELMGGLMHKVSDANGNDYVVSENGNLIYGDGKVYHPSQFQNGHLEGKDVEALVQKHSRGEDLTKEENDRLMGNFHLPGFRYLGYRGKNQHLVADANGKHYFLNGDGVLTIPGTHEEDFEDAYRSPTDFENGVPKEGAPKKSLDEQLAQEYEKKSAKNLPGREKPVEMSAKDWAVYRHHHARRGEWIAKEAKARGITPAVLSRMADLESKVFVSGNATDGEKQELLGLHKRARTEEEAHTRVKDYLKNASALPPETKKQIIESAKKAQSGLEAKGWSKGQIFALAALAMVALPMLLGRRSRWLGLALGGVMLQLFMHNRGGEEPAAAPKGDGLPTDVPAGGKPVASAKDFAEQVAKAAGTPAAASTIEEAISGQSAESRPHDTETAAFWQAALNPKAKTKKPPPPG